MVWGEGGKREGRQRDLGAMGKRVAPVGVNFGGGYRHFGKGGDGSGVGKKAATTEG